MCIRDRLLSLSASCRCTGPQVPPAAFAFACFRKALITDTEGCAERKQAAAVLAFLDILLSLIHILIPGVRRQFTKFLPVLFRFHKDSKPRDCLLQISKLCQQLPALFPGYGGGDVYKRQVVNRGYADAQGYFMNIC